MPSGPVLVPAVMPPTSAIDFTVPDMGAVTTVESRLAFTLSSSAILVFLSYSAWAIVALSWVICAEYPSRSVELAEAIIFSREAIWAFESAILVSYRSISISICCIFRSMVVVS